MIPCMTKWWLIGFRSVGLNDEPVKPAWGMTRTQAERRWMNRYNQWCA